MIRLTPNSESLREFNTCHVPAGSTIGGRFCSKDAAEAIRTASPAFKAWFGNSKVVDEDGHPLRVFHGSLSNFDEFDPDRSNIESDMGAGLYFTNNLDDANANYSTLQGADPDVKIQTRAEQLENDLDSGNKAVEAFVYNWVENYKGEGVATVAEALRALAAQELGIVHGGVSIPVYLRMENPAVVASLGEPSTFLDYETPYDEDTEEYGEPTGKMAEFLSALRSVADDFNDGAQNVFDHLSGEALDHGGMALSSIIDRLRKDDYFGSYTDPDTGKLASSEIIRRALQQVGFDGIIDKSVRAKFSRMKGVHSDTVHYIVFDPTQVKSAVGNKGTYSRRSRKFTERRR